MGKETERKFLVRGDFKHHSVEEINIIQAYLSVDPLRTIRIRICNNRAILTIKSNDRGTIYERSEWETELAVQDAREILEICLPGRIEKTRYLVPWGNHLFEVDVFHGKNEGLVIAEIELKSLDDHFEMPEWLGEEVTGKPGYYNSNLI